MIAISNEDDTGEQIMNGVTDEAQTNSMIGKLPMKQVCFILFACVNEMVDKVANEAFYIVTNEVLDEAKISKIITVHLTPTICQTQTPLPTTHNYLNKI